MNLTESVRSQALALLGAKDLSQNHLNQVLRLFAKHRSALLQNTLVKLHGTRVLGGPFAGMEYMASSTEGCLMAKLLGCYEQELYPAVEAIVATAYDTVVNIGSSEGYYSVGLARRCPGVRVVSYDINPVAQAACNNLAARNGVADRVSVAGLFAPASFKDFRGSNTLFLIDIEGNELALLEGVPAAELAGFDFLVECHDCFGSPVSDRLLRHLTPTHDTAILRQEIRATRLPSLFDQFGHLDQLLAIWEWRGGPTPWLLAASRQQPDNEFRRTVRGMTK